MLLGFQRRGLSFLRFDRASFYRSFAAPLILLPLHFWTLQVAYFIQIEDMQVMGLLEHQDQLFVPSPWYKPIYITVEFALYVAGPILTALALYPIAVLAKRQEPFRRWIIAVNWLGVSWGLLFYWPQLGASLQQAHTGGYLDATFPLTIFSGFSALWAVVIFVWLARRMLNARWYVIAPVLIYFAVAVVGFAMLKSRVSELVLIGING